MLSRLEGHLQRSCEPGLWQKLQVTCLSMQGFLSMEPAASLQSSLWAGLARDMEDPGLENIFGQEQGLGRRAAWRSLVDDPDVGRSLGRGAGVGRDQ